MALMFQFPYRQSREGYWGAHTSTLNWCEEDYNVTYYCAELVNTLTNGVFLYLGLRGVRNCIVYQHPPIYILGYIGYIVVGLGSIAFHTTLKYSMQLADELPMIYSTCIIAFAALSYKQSTQMAVLIALGSLTMTIAVITLASSITAYYLYAKNPVFHQVAYAILTVSTISRGMYVMEYHLRPAIKKRNPASSDMILRDMWAMAATGISSFLIGFFLWNMDNIYCHQLRGWRNDYLMLPWGAILEGHGWWHLFTGIGGVSLSLLNIWILGALLRQLANDRVYPAYYFITWRVWLHRCLDGGEKEFYLHWPSAFTSVPEVRRRQEVEKPRKAE